MFKGEFDCMLKIVHEIFHELELFGNAQQNNEDVIYESFPEGDYQIKILFLRDYL